MKIIWVILHQWPHHYNPFWWTLINLEENSAEFSPPDHFHPLFHGDLVVMITMFIRGDVGQSFLVGFSISFTPFPVTSTLPSSSSFSSPPSTASSSQWPPSSMLWVSFLIFYRFLGHISQTSLLVSTVCPDFITPILVSWGNLGDKCELCTAGPTTCETKKKRFPKMKLNSSLEDFHKRGFSPKPFSLSNIFLTCGGV